MSEVYRVAIPTHWFLKGPLSIFQLPLSFPPSSNQQQFLKSINIQWAHKVYPVF